MAVTAYPWLFAGSRVLLRLLMPRHPPLALSNFSFNIFHLYSYPSVNIFSRIFLREVLLHSFCPTYSNK